MWPQPVTTTQRYEQRLLLLVASKAFKEEEEYKWWLKQKAKKVKLLNRNSSQKTLLKDFKYKGQTPESLSNKIVLTRKILLLFDQGLMSSG